MGRKANPDASYLDIEKSFYKNKGKLVEVEELPFDGSKKGKSSSSLDDLGLVRPAPIKGTKSKSNDNEPASKVRKPSKPESKAVNIKKSSVPNVILRKPTVYNEDDNEDTSSRLRIKPNLSLKMQNGQVKDKFSDMTLLRKPVPSIAEDTDQKQEPSNLVNAQMANDNDLKRRKEPDDETSNLILLERPEKVAGKNEDKEFGDVEVTVPDDGLEQHKQIFLESNQEQTGSSQQSDLNSVDSRVELSVEAALQGKPKRLDQSVKQISKSTEKETAFENTREYRGTDELENLQATPKFQESEDADWTRAEDLVKTGDRENVELVSCSTRGFVVSFGSLVGFLPYRNLAPKWKFFAFESWLRRKGLDPSIYKQNLGIITSNDAENRNFPLNSPQYTKVDNTVEEKITSDMKLEDLLRIYDQEKIKFLSSFIGQKVKANVVLADRKMRKLILSLRPKEKEELVEKKRNLMARLQVGDIVKCSIQKITYFGIFVEVEGVPALIHQTEVSWDATLDPTSYFKIGQVVEAKVHQLNFALERIFLSLKEIMPDPLLESLESVVGDNDPIDERLEAAQTDEEEDLSEVKLPVPVEGSSLVVKLTSWKSGDRKWSEVESLIKELQQIDGIQSVTKGRFFRSPGLAPTFQVYMASIFEDQYKLLARSGNRIQEVIVQTSMDKEKMKSAILTCTNRVE
ncbi:30S ribosomal protein S1 [Senna tora]|uniref:30S ribosomal protein S1 n=1 Tax=Senna tora TaxID=362788 RepID=A0A834SV30_9FABA|nr:30S ribosomal protein S1 [Senna tora]